MKTIESNSITIENRSIVYLNKITEFTDSFNLVGDFTKEEGFKHLLKFQSTYLSQNITCIPNSNLLTIRLTDNEFNTWMKLLEELKTFYETNIKGGLTNE